MANVNTNKKVDVEEVMNKIKVLGNPIYKSDFWFYVKGDPETVFHVSEGNGSNLLPEDEEEGFQDYIYYEIFTGDISYKMIQKYIEGEDERLGALMFDGGQVMLYKFYRDLTVEQICYKVLRMAGYQKPERLTVRILSETYLGNSHSKKEEEEKEEEKNSDSLKRQTCIAIWYKTKGNMKKAVEILRNKIPLDPGYVKAVAKAEKEEVAKMGAILHVVVDDDFPEELKELEDVSLCYIEKKGYYSPFPVFCGIK